MDSTIIAGIMTGICSLLSALLAYLLTRRHARLEARRQAEHDKPPIPEIKRQQVTGEWKGIASIEAIPDLLVEYAVTARIIASEKTIHAITEIHAFVDDGREISDVLEVFGTMMLNYLKLEFTVKDQPHTIQFGYLILKLQPSGTQLKGKFASFSPHFDQIVSGSVVLDRKSDTHQ